MQLFGKDMDDAPKMTSINLHHLLGSAIVLIKRKTSICTLVQRQLIIIAGFEFLASWANADGFADQLSVLLPCTSTIHI